METKRLIIRRFLKTDLNDYYEFSKVLIVGKLAGWEPSKTIKDAKKKLKQLIKNKNYYAIILKENNKLIGSISYRINENKNLELGYSLNINYWNNGYITESARKMIEYLFLNTKYESIYAKVISYNISSNKVLKKLNFDFLETKKNAGFDLLNNLYDLNIYVLKKEKWKEIYYEN